MSAFGEFMPVLSDTENVLAGDCTCRCVLRQPAAPAYSLGITNPVTDFWEDENGGLIQDGDLSPITL
jgi:hypothetical protein